MPDLNTPARFLPGNGEGRVAVYEKQQIAQVAFFCEGCRGKVFAGQRYLRLQLVNEEPGEDLSDREQARKVNFCRRVILKVHRRCVPSDLKEKP